jgi:sRNA-binding carbon storage regulator CsrA
MLSLTRKRGEFVLIGADQVVRVLRTTTDEVTLQLIGQARGAQRLRMGEELPLAGGTIRLLAAGIEPRLGFDYPPTVQILRGEVPDRSLVDELKAELRRRGQQRQQAG